EQRAGEQERGADLLRERRGHLGALKRAGHPNAVAIELLDLRAERARDLEHPADVPDPRDVVQGDRVVGEQASRDQRESLGLTPCGSNLTVYKRPALQHESCIMPTA